MALHEAAHHLGLAAGTKSRSATLPNDFVAIKFSIISPRSIEKVDERSHRSGRCSVGAPQGPAGRDLRVSPSSDCPLSGFSAGPRHR